MDFRKGALTKSSSYLGILGILKTLDLYNPLTSNIVQSFRQLNC